jgi:hypothetical protein
VRPAVLSKHDRGQPAAPDTECPQPPGAGSTELVEVGDGTEKVTFERRWPDARSAEGTALVEVQVTEEIWGRRHAWEATASRHVLETLQLGVRARDGRITWGAAHEVANDLGLRRRG